MNCRTPPASSHGDRTRRSVLRAACGVGAAATAGCLSLGASEPTYALSARLVGDSLAGAVRWTPRGPFAEADSALVGQLLDRGSLTTAGFALAPAGDDRPRYVERDGTFHRLSVARRGTVERDHWLLWFDLLDGDPPADATVFDSALGVGGGTDLRAAYGLSEADVRVVEDAAGQVPTEFGYRDLADAPPGQRGHVFVRRAADETALVPEPPFTHVAFRTGDGARYARAVVERATVELPRYDHAVEHVADSPAGYVAHVRDRHLATSFERAALPASRRELLDSVTGGPPPTADEGGGQPVDPTGPHEEQPPLSDAMTVVLDRLGLSGLEPPADGGVRFSTDAYFRYAGAHFAGQLEISG